MKLCKVLNVIQFINWLLCCFGIIYLIFVDDNPRWFLALGIGVLIQLCLLATNWILGIKANSKWALYNIVLLLLILFFELDNHDVIRTKLFTGESGFAMIYLFVILINGLFLFSIRYIMMEYRIVKAL